VPGTRYVGRGKVAMGRREDTEPGEGSLTAEVRTPVASGVGGRGDGLTIAQRKAAERAAQQRLAQDPVADAPTDDATGDAPAEGSER